MADHWLDSGPERPVELDVADNTAEAAFLLRALRQQLDTSEELQRQLLDATLQHTRAAEGTEALLRSIKFALYVIALLLVTVIALLN